MAFLIGTVQLLAGLLNFGEVTKFISRSVVVGYSTGIGILLIASQLHNLLGYSVGPAQSFLTNVVQAAKDFGTGGIQLWSLGIGVLTIAIFETVKRFKPKWPEALIGLAVLGIGARIASIGHPHLPFRLIKDEGVLTTVIPAWAGLHISSEKLHIIPQLAGTAIAIAILGMLEAASITKSLAAKSGQKIEPNQELIGMGAANIFCALFGAVPGSSSFARSAVNYQSGAASQLSSMMSSVVVLVVIAFVTPVFNYIPVAALAAHLIRVGVKMINRNQIRIAARSTPSDLVVFVITLAACLLLQLDTAIYIGIGVALALFLQKSSTPTLVEYPRNQRKRQSGTNCPTAISASSSSGDIDHPRQEGELFFGAADLFREQVRRLAEDQNIRIFILRMRRMRSTWTLRRSWPSRSCTTI